MFLYAIDPLYWAMMIPTLLLSLYASFKVKSTYNHYSKIGTQSRKSGAQVAREILDRNGLAHVTVVETNGFLSDHYDPAKKVVRLSPSNFRGTSVAAIGVAAHETGHAIQHAKAYGPLALRNTMVPLASIGSNLSYIIIFIGFFFSALGLVKLGIILFSAVVAFQIITLPVEFDASARAKNILASYHIVTTQELGGVRKVLNAAAMTYVAAALSSVLTLLYFLLRSGLLGGSDD